MERLTVQLIAVMGLLLFCASPVAAQGLPPVVITSTSSIYTLTGILRTDGPAVYQGLPAEGLQPLEYDTDYQSMDFGLGVDELWFMGRVGLTLYDVISHNDAWPFLIVFIVISFAAGIVIKIIVDIRTERYE